MIDERHRKLRYNLKVAIKSRDRYQLDYNITEFKKEKLEDTDMDLVKAEKILKELLVRDGKCSCYISSLSISLEMRIDYINSKNCDYAVVSFKSV